MKQAEVALDVQGWNAIIGAYGHFGQGGKALALFEEMNRKGITPTNVTFVNAINACSHSGLVKEAFQVYNNMKTQFHIKPTARLQNCVVDVLARNGNIRGALDFIQTEEMKPDFVTWTSLLAACRSHRDVKHAEYAASEALKLEPQSAAVYITLANVYGEAGQTQDRINTIKKMEESGAKKSPGLSWIEVGGAIHSFKSRETSHEDLPPIHEKLDMFTRDLKKNGFQAQYHDGEEEDLQFHSEKMALALGLIHSQAGQRLIISKNLRMCGNCHTSFKLFSGMYQREIVVRDAARFHVFTDGKCSCDDHY